jgi:hypothetical protein
MVSDENSEHISTPYLEQIFKIAQDRRYSTAIDVWAIILDAEFSNRKYSSLDGKSIMGITAADIASSLNMHLSSVYHNLKILQADSLELLETDDLLIYNEKGRRVKQKVYRIPRSYYEEFRQILDELHHEGFRKPHRMFTFFNLLKIKGILSHYAALLHKDRVLVENEIEEVEDWYPKWLSPINLRNNIVTPGVLYKFSQEDMNKVLDSIIEILDDYTDSYSEEDEERGILPVSFTYLVLVPYTQQMRNGEWMNREEYDERIAESIAKTAKDDLLECTKDHDTFSRYGLACPVCGEKPRNK